MGRENDSDAMRGVQHGAREAGKSVVVLQNQSFFDAFVEFVVRFCFVTIIFRVSSFVFRLFVFTILFFFFLFSAWSFLYCA